MKNDFYVNKCCLIKRHEHHCKKAGIKRGILGYQSFNKLSIGGTFSLLNRRSMRGSTHRGVGGSELFDQISVTDWY